MSIDATAQMRNGTSTQMTTDIVERERSALMWHSRLRLVHWIAIAMSLILTFSIWYYARAQINLRTEARFNFAVEQVSELIQERLEEYELALWGGVAMLRTHDNDVDLLKWRTFASNLDIEHRFPGINGIGVIHEISSKNLESYLAEQRELRPDFKIHPAHDGTHYQPITFIEPVEINQEAVGLDMMHETNRHSSLNKARDSDTAQITGPIILVQDKTKTPGFLFFAPFYKSDDHDTLETRRTHFAGAVYAPFVVSKLMDGVLDKDRRATAIRITDGEEVIYDEINSQDVDYDTASLGEKRVVIEFYGRKWLLDVRAGLDFRANNTGFESTALLIAGILLDFALLSLFVLLSRANRRGLAFADLATSALDSKRLALKESNKQLNIARIEAEGVSEMKSQFLSTISHEVRTPLTAISGILVLLERADLPTKQSQLVQAGKRASENLIKLLTDVLDSSRLEANAVELWEREVLILPLVEEWQTLANGMVGKLEKDILVRTEILPDAPSRIYADDIRLSQVLNNLMDNAIRFTEHGHITIRISAETGDTSPKANIIIAIEDTGIGIAEDDLAVIFERFRQVDGSVTRTRGGAGLGLAISHDLIGLMGGELKVSSTLGEGTTFEVHLPVQGTTLKGNPNE